MRLPVKNLFILFILLCFVVFKLNLSVEFVFKAEIMKTKNEHMTAMFATFQRMASPSVHHHQCTNTSAPTSVHHHRCSNIGASPSVHHHRCITIGALTFFCITIGASPSVHQHRCIIIGASSSVQQLTHMSFDDTSVLVLIASPVAPRD